MTSSSNQNYYQILELENFADLERVKAAFRRLARSYHPDLNAGNKEKEERFKQINEAYEILGNADKKTFYDDALRLRLKAKDITERSTSGQAGPGGEAAYKTHQKSHKKPHDSVHEKKHTASDGEKKSDNASAHDFFETVRKAFAHDAPPAKKAHSHHATHQHHEKTGKPKRGQDVHVETLVSNQEATEGVVKTVNVQQQELCKRCSGTGKVTGKECPLCQGQKILTRLKKIDVRIPIGVKSGSKVRVAGEGARGEFGGEAGDLFLLIQVMGESGKSSKPGEAHREELRIEGLDVFGDVEISMPEAVLGTNAQVKTLHGNVRMTIPALTSSGRVLRLKDQGVTNDTGKGDHYVTIRIVSPENISPRERELYEELLRLQQK